MNAEIEAIQRQIQDLKAKLAHARLKAEPEPVRDYTLRRPDGTSVHLSDLFAGKSDLLLIHNMGRQCVFCTLWADGFSSVARHVQDRAAFVLASPDEPDVLRAFIASRESVVGPGSWRFPAVSFAGTTLASDMGYEPEPGKPHPGISALHRRPDGTIVRTGTSPFGPGDDFCSVWPMLELLEGGAKGWSPKYAY